MAPTRRNKAPVLPLKPDYKLDEVEYIKHRRSTTLPDGSSEEFQERIPKLTDDASAYYILRFFNQFQHCRSIMSWTTGPRLYAKFIIHLSDMHRMNWESQIVGQAETVATFDAQIQLFKSSLLLGYSYHDQMAYLRSVRKPVELTPTQFLLQFQAAEANAKLLPNAPQVNAGFSEIERKRLFLEAMPMAWQDKFDDANLVIEAETLMDMRAYFDKQHVKDPPKDRTSSSVNKSDNNSSNSQRSGRSRRRNQNQATNQGNRSGGSGNSGGNNSGNQNQNGSNRSNNRSERSNNRVSNDDPCPVHPNSNHTWGQCRANRFGNAAGQGQQGSNQQGQQQRQQNHFQNRGNNNGNQGSSQTTARNNSNNTSETQGQSREQQEQHYFDAITAENLYCVPCNAESFLYDEGVQEELEEELETPVQPTKASLEAPKDVMPITLTIVKQVGDKKGQWLYRSLFDHGGSDVLVKKSKLPKDAIIEPSNTNFSTASGALGILGSIQLKEVILPEFSFSRRIAVVKAFVFDNDDVPHDIIYGRSFLNEFKLDVCSSDLTCRWHELSIPFHSPSFLGSKDSVRDILSVPSKRVERLQENHAIAVTQTKATKVSVDELMAKQAHLNQDQRDAIKQVLMQFKDLFDGSLGRYPKRQFHIDLKAGSVPYHCKGPYSVPAINLGVLKQELYRQVDIGVLTRVGESEWGMPMMAIPKKDGSIRTVDDFRELNKCIQRKSYPLPKIQDIFHRRQGYQYVTILDLTACYYTYELDEESSWYCVLVTPFGKFKRNRLPQGLCQSPDWAQAAIEEVFYEADLLRTCVEAFIDDVGVFSNSFNEHIKHLTATLTCLQQNGYTVNPAKCQWAVKEVEWLGHYLTPNGIKPLPKKIKGILQLTRPTTVTELRSFIGMVNFYRDFWKQRAHILAPLTALTKTPKGRPLPWTDECNKAFQAIKAVLQEEVLLYYPDPNKTFYIEPDASKRQLGATIYQRLPGGHKQPVAFFSRKLTPAQTRYPASDLEALCITEVFEEFRPILYGASIVVRTDHQNLTRRDLKSHRLLHWRLLLEEFAPQFEYLPGPENVVADALSRLPMTPISEEQTLLTPEELFRESLLFYPPEIDAFPLAFDHLSQLQRDDPQMLPLADLDDFDLQEFNGVELVCKRVNNQWKPVLPEALIAPTIEWYHLILNHCGSTRLVETLRCHLWIPNLQRRVTEYVSTCDHCQRFKQPGPGYGHLPPKNDVAQPWEEVAVDLIGPWTLQLPAGMLTIQALTVVDVTTTLAECVRIENKTSAHCAMQFVNHWVARYPRPTRCIHDQGKEFVGFDFQSTLAVNGIKAVPTSVKNPQANAVCERLHKTIQDLINTSVRTPPNNVNNAIELVDSCLASAVRSLRSVVHQGLKVSPGALVFGRDMVLPIPILADYNLIRERRQAIIDDNNRRANLRRRFKDYQVNEQVLILERPLGKLKPKTSGPFPISAIHVNGTVTIQRGPGIHERLSIRRVKPYLLRN